MSWLFSPGTPARAEAVANLDGWPNRWVSRVGTPADAVKWLIADIVVHTHQEFGWEAYPNAAMPGTSMADPRYRDTTNAVMTTGLAERHGAAGIRDAFVAMSQSWRSGFSPSCTVPMRSACRTRVSVRRS